MDEIKKLYDAVSQKFDVGTFDEFSGKMTDVESRKRFYDVVSEKGFDIGDYDTYEQRLSGGKPKGVKAEVDGESVSTSASMNSLSDSNQEEVNTEQEKIDRLKRASEQINKINNTKSQKEKKGYFSNLVDNLALGSTELGVALAAIPETLYDIGSIPQNLVAELFDIEELKASSEKFKEDYDIKNPIMDFYMDESEKLQGEIAQFNEKYESTSVYENIKKGNYGDAFELLGSSIAQSTPISMSMMVGGAATNLGKMAAGSTVALAGRERQDLDPNLSELEKTLKSLSLAGAESVFATISSGSMGKVYKDIIMKEGKEEGAKVFKKGLIDMYQTALKKYGAAAGAVGEGIEEVATQVTQNMINGKPAMEGVEDAFLTGMGSGGVYGAPITVKQVSDNIKKAYQKRQIDKIVESDDNQLNSMTEAFNPYEGFEIKPEGVDIIEASGSLDLLKEDLDKMVNNDEISREDADAHIEKYLKAAKAVSMTKDMKLDSNKKAQVVNLINRKEQLVQEVKGMDDVLAEPKKQEIEQINNSIRETVLGKPVNKDGQQKTLITPDNSSNYANMTEDGGDFIFFHEGAQGYETIKPSTGQTATSKQEAAALSKVGGVAMYYTDPNATERQSASGTRYAVRVPKEKVYDFNTDPLNLIEEAEKRHQKENPDKAFDPNTQVAYVTKIAGEKGFDMVVSEWNGKTRAQTTKELKPTDVRTKDGDTVTKPFKSQYQGNTDKGFKSVIPKTKNEALNEAYDVIYKERNKEGVYDELYHLYTEKGKYTQDQITKMVEQSDLSPEAKQTYMDAVNMEQETRRSKPLERTKGVEIQGSPEGSYINVGMKSGKTDKDISEAQILQNLPSDVTVEQKGIKTVESDGGTENTLSLKLSRPLTNGEMRNLLEGTEQMAIPQLSEGTGVMFGTKDWGDFNSQFFAMPDGKQLNEITNEQNTQVQENTDNTQNNQTEGEGGEGTIQTRTNTGTVGNVQDSSREIAKKSIEIANKIRTLKINKSVKDSLSKLNNRPTALFELAWDGAIETVATTLELTGNATQAIYSGVESLRNSDWYKGLSKEGRVKAERKFRESVKNQIGDVKEDTSFLDSMKASYNRTREVVIQKLVDKYYILRQTVNKNFDIVDDSVNFSQAEINMHGKAANDLDKFDAEMRKVIEEIADKGYSVKQVSDYLYAKHAAERNAHIKKYIDPENEFGSGMTPQEADEILNGTYIPEQLQELEKISEQFKDIIKGTREIMLEYGLITREQYNGLTDYYQNYVPLKGFDNQEIEAGTDLQGNDISVDGQIIRRTAGRSTKADNVIANIVSQRVAVTLKARKNEVLQTLYKLAETQPDNGVMKLYTQETLPKKMTVQADGKQVMTPERPTDRKDYVGVKVDGKQYYLKFANAELGRVLNAANIEKTSLIGKILSALNRYLSTTLTTLDPEFVISNFTRDIQTAVFNVMAEADINENFDGENIARQVVKDTRRSIAAIYGNERKGKVDTEFQKYYQEFKEDGAKTGWANQNNLDDIKRKLEGVHKLKTAKGLNFTSAKGQAKNLLEFINDVNTSVENGVRLAAYINARKAGLTRPQAAAMAKELTVNFNKSGEYGSLFNSMYLFFNASIQGNVRFIKAMTTLKKTVDSQGNVNKSLNRGQKLALAMTAFASVVTMLNQAISDDDEDGESFFSKIPDYEKERNLIIMNPANGRDYFKIPLPYGYNIFHNLGSVATEISTGDREVGDGIGFLTSATIGAFSPINFGNSDNAANAIINAATPTVAKPIVDLAKNEDFFGSQIYNENLPFGVPKPDAAMGRRTTPQAFKSITTFLNEISGGNEAESGSLDFSPESLYYLFKFGVGGTGKFLTNVATTAGTAVDVAQGKPEEFELRKTPFVRKVYAEHNKYVDQTKYFERFNKIRQREKAIELRRDENKLKPEDRANFGKVSGVVKVYEEVGKKLKEIREMKKQAEKITDPIKRSEKLNYLDDKYYNLIKKANKMYNDKLGKNYK